ncbi:MAG TPA: hypothetical protein VII58_00440 [Acidobacteriaceae bacterium]
MTARLLGGLDETNPRWSFGSSTENSDATLTNGWAHMSSTY